MSPEKASSFHLYSSPIPVILNDTKCTISQRKITHLFTESQAYLSNFPYLLAQITDINGTINYYDGIQLHKSALERVRSPSAFTDNLKASINSIRQPLLINPNTGIKVHNATFYVYTKTSDSKIPELSKLFSYSLPTEILKTDPLISCFDYSTEGAPKRIEFLKNYTISSTPIEHSIAHSIHAISNAETLQYFIKSPQQLVSYANACINIGLYNSAIHFCQQAADLITKEKVDSSTLLELADTLYELRDKKPSLSTSAPTLYLQYVSSEETRTSSHVFYTLGEIHRLGECHIPVNLEKAAVFYKAALKKDPHNFLASASLIVTLQAEEKKTENSKAAMNCFHNTLKIALQTENLFTQFYEAITTHDQLLLSSTMLLETLDTAVKIDPKNHCATLNLGKLLLYSGDSSEPTIEKATRLLQLADSLKKDSSEGVLTLAKAHSTGCEKIKIDQVKAVKLYGDALSVTPLHPRALKELLKLLTQKCSPVRDLTKARLILERTLENEPNHIFALCHLAKLTTLQIDQATVTTKTLTIAQQLLNKAYSLNPYNIKIFCLNGDIIKSYYSGVESPHPALAQYRIALTYAPQNEKIKKKIANFYSSEKSITELVMCLESMLKIDPDSYFCKKSLGLLLCKKDPLITKDLPRALDLLKEAHLEDDQDIEVMHSMAKIYQKKGVQDKACLSKAEELYTQILLLDPTNEDSCLNLFKLYMNNKPEAAKKVLQKALEMAPENLVFAKHLAQYAFDFPEHFTSDPDLAHKMATSVVSKDPTNKECLRILAEIYTDGMGSIKKNINSSLDIYRTLYKIDPSDEDTILELSQLLLNHAPSIEHQNEALIILENAVSLYPDDNDYKVLLAEALAFDVDPALSNPKKAYQLFEQAILTNKDDLCMLKSFAKFLSNPPKDIERDLPRAELLLRDIFNKAPDMNHLKQLLGCLEKQTKIPDAIHLLSQNTHLFYEMAEYTTEKERLNSLISSKLSFI